MRLKAINSYLPYLGLTSGGAALDETELAKVVTNNILESWNARFKLAGGYNSTTVTEALKVLNLLQKEEKGIQKNPKGGKSGERSKNKNPNGGGGGGPKQKKVDDETAPQFLQAPRIPRP